MKTESALERARKEYKTGNSETRESLEKIFGKAALSNFSWQEIKTFELACQVEGVDPVKFVKDLEEKGDTIDEIAYKQLKLIIRVINGGWIPERANAKQEKWFPVFNCKAGFGFSGAYTYYDYSSANLGSRLELENEPKAIHMGTHFLKQYENFLM